MRKDKNAEQKHGLWDYKPSEIYKALEGGNLLLSRMYDKEFDSILFKFQNTKT